MILSTLRDATGTVALSTSNILFAFGKQVPTSQDPSFVEN